MTEPYVPEFVRQKHAGFQQLPQTEMTASNDDEPPPSFRWTVRCLRALHILSYATQEQGITIASVGVGLLVGAMLCFSNMYFGLQTGS